MNKSPLVSILIPVYGVERYIVRCLQSVINQTYKQFELIIVDDCSLDRSIELAEDFLKSFSVDYSVVRHPTNLGLAGARNSGVKNANGSILYFLDSDDYLLPNSIHDYVKSLILNDSDIVVSDFFIKIDNTLQYNKVSINLDVKEYLKSSLLRKSSFNICGKLFKKELFSKLSFVEGINMGEDYLMFNKVLSFAQKVSYVSSPLYIYDKSNESSYTNRIDMRLIRQLIDAQINLNQFYINNSDVKTLMPYSNAQIIVHMLKMSFNNKDAYGFVFSKCHEFNFKAKKLNYIDFCIFTLYKLKMKGFLRAVLALGNKVIRIIR